MLKENFSRIYTPLTGQSIAVYVLMLRLFWPKASQPLLPFLMPILLAKAWSVPRLSWLSPPHKLQPYHYRQSLLPLSSPSPSPSPLPRLWPSYTIAIAKTILCRNKWSANPKPEFEKINPSFGQTQFDFPLLYHKYTIKRQVTIKIPCDHLHSATC